MLSEVIGVFINIFTRFKRAPIMMLAVILFAAILVTVLCGLQRNIDNEKAEYEETYRSVPVSLRVCNLTGTEYDNLYAYTYVMNALRSDFELGAYVKDVQLKSTYRTAKLKVGEETLVFPKLVGITSPEIDSTLSQRTDNVFAWFDGYDESILKTNELVCIIPEGLMPEADEEIIGATLTVTYNSVLAKKSTVTRTVKIVGTHNAKSDNIYCPYYMLLDINRNLGATTLIDAAGAVLADNHKLEEFREASKEWFPEPNMTGETVEWDYAHFTYYPVALEIDDSKLIEAAEAMENSIKINRLCAYIVLALSAVAGFFAAFLSIRSRKREITLMRSLGNSGLGIFMGYTFEQLVCLVLGTAIGGAAFRWQPAEQIGMFLGIYFLGLTLALIIFVSRNLLSGQKEDE